MARTNHYRICQDCTTDEMCERHSYHHTWWHYNHKPQREITGRRTWRRKARYPKFSYKTHHNPPPRWWWQEQHAKYRRICSQLMRRSDDPVLPRDKDIIDLWGWY